MEIRCTEAGVVVGELLRQGGPGQEALTALPRK